MQGKAKKRDRECGAHHNRTETQEHAKKRTPINRFGSGKILISRARAAFVRYWRRIHEKALTPLKKEWSRKTSAIASFGENAQPFRSARGRRSRNFCPANDKWGGAIMRVFGSIRGMKANALLIAGYAFIIGRALGKLDQH